jgi:hypothetical protein
MTLALTLPATGWLRNWYVHSSQPSICVCDSLLFFSFVNCPNYSLLSHSLQQDGVRAYFDGTNFYSRAGNKFHAPPFFSKHLPANQPLDGELWLGRGRFQQCISIVRNQKADRADEWKEMTFLVFDAPKLDLTYEKRLDYLKSIMPTFGKDAIQSSSPNAASNKVPPYARIVPVQKCLSKTHLLRELDHVQTHGGEGIMVRFNSIFALYLFYFCLSVIASPAKNVDVIFISFVPLVKSPKIKIRVQEIKDTAQGQDIF